MSARKERITSSLRMMIFCVAELFDWCAGARHGRCLGHNFDGLCVSCDLMVPSLLSL
jgi:hypothetical protein